jgi:sialate O-acetylesterase
MFLRTDTEILPLSGEWMYRISSEGFKLDSRNALDPNSLPTLLFNGMINPLLDYRVTGVIWNREKPMPVRRTSTGHGSPI